MNLTVLANGQVACSGPRVTNEHCVTTCNPGYSLVGSNNRTCQSNHTWSGEDTECLPMECSQPTAPDNALVVSPCDNEFQSVCTIVCNNGYHVSNSSYSNQFTISCVLNDLNTTVEWTEASTCIGELIGILHIVV